MEFHLRRETRKFISKASIFMKKKSGAANERVRWTWARIRIWSGLEKYGKINETSKGIFSTDRNERKHPRSEIRKTPRAGRSPIFVGMMSFSTQVSQVRIHHRTALDSRLHVLLRSWKMDMTSPSLRRSRIFFFFLTKNAMNHTLGSRNCVFLQSWPRTCLIVALGERVATK